MLVGVLTTQWRGINCGGRFELSFGSSWHVNWKVLAKNATFAMLARGHVEIATTMSLETARYPYTGTKALGRSEHFVSVLQY
jgi:hypothetical protein